VPGSAARELARHRYPSWLNAFTAWRANALISALDVG
jgi:hypothetical protein